MSLSEYLDSILKRSNQSSFSDYLDTQLNSGDDVSLPDGRAAIRRGNWLYDKVSGAMIGSASMLDSGALQQDLPEAQAASNPQSAASILLENEGKTFTDPVHTLGSIGAGAVGLVAGMPVGIYRQGAETQAEIYKKLHEWTGLDTAESAGDMFGAAGKVAADASKSIKDLQAEMRGKDPSLIQQALAQGPQMGAQMAATIYGGPAAGMALMAAQTLASSYEEQADSGVNPIRATLTSIPSAMIQARLESFLPERLVKGLKAKPGMWKALEGYVYSAAQESGTEGLQGETQILTDLAGGMYTKSDGDIDTNKLLSDMNPAGKVIGPQIAIGALAGGSTNVLTDATISSMDKLGILKTAQIVTPDGDTTVVTPRFARSNNLDFLDVDTASLGGQIVDLKTKLNTAIEFGNVEEQKSLLDQLDEITPEYIKRMEKDLQDPNKRIPSLGLHQAVTEQSNKLYTLDADKVLAYQAMAGDRAAPAGMEIDPETRLPKLLVAQAAIPGANEAIKAVAEASMLYHGAIGRLSDTYQQAYDAANWKFDELLQSGEKTEEERPPYVKDALDNSKTPYVAEVSRNTQTSSPQEAASVIDFNARRYTMQSSPEEAKKFYESVGTSTEIRETIIKDSVLAEAAKPPVDMSINKEWLTVNYKAWINNLVSRINKSGSYDSKMVMEAIKEEKPAGMSDEDFVESLFTGNHGISTESAREIIGDIEDLGLSKGFDPRKVYATDVYEQHVAKTKRIKNSMSYATWVKDQIQGETPWNNLANAVGGPAVAIEKIADAVLNGKQRDKSTIEAALVSAVIKYVEDATDIQYDPDSSFEDVVIGRPEGWSEGKREHEAGIEASSRSFGSSLSSTATTIQSAQMRSRKGTLVNLSILLEPEALIEDGFGQPATTLAIEGETLVSGKSLATIERKNIIDIAEGLAKLYRDGAIDHSVMLSLYSGKQKAAKNAHNIEKALNLLGITSGADASSIALLADKMSSTYAPEAVFYNAIEAGANPEEASALARLMGNHAQFIRKYMPTVQVVRGLRDALGYASSSQRHFGFNSGQHVNAFIKPALGDLGEGGVYSEETAPSPDMVGQPINPIDVQSLLDQDKNYEDYTLNINRSGIVQTILHEFMHAVDSNADWDNATGDLLKVKKFIESIQGTMAGKKGRTRQFREEVVPVMAQAVVQWANQGMIQRPTGVTLGEFITLQELGSKKSSGYPDLLSEISNRLYEELNKTNSAVVPALVRFVAGKLDKTSSDDTRVWSETDDRVTKTSESYWKDREYALEAIQKAQQVETALEEGVKTPDTIEHKDVQDYLDGIDRAYREEPQIRTIARDHAKNIPSPTNPNVVFDALDPKPVDINNPLGYSDIEDSSLSLDDAAWMLGAEAAPPSGSGGGGSVVQTGPITPGGKRVIGKAKLTNWSAPQAQRSTLKGYYDWAVGHFFTDKTGASRAFAYSRDQFGQLGLQGGSNTRMAGYSFLPGPARTLFSVELEKGLTRARQNVTVWKERANIAAQKYMSALYDYADANGLDEKGISDLRAKTWEARISGDMSIIPKELADASGALYGVVEDLTNQLIKDGIVDKKTAKRYKADLSVYLHRDYRAFKQKNWVNVAMKDTVAWQAAMDRAMERAYAMGKRDIPDDPENPNDATQAAKDFLGYLLRTRIEGEEVKGKSGGGSKVVSSLDKAEMLTRLGKYGKDFFKYADRYNASIRAAEKELADDPTLKDVIFIPPKKTNTELFDMWREEWLQKIKDDPKATDLMKENAARPYKRMGDTMVSTRAQYGKLTDDQVIRAALDEEDMPQAYRTVMGEIKDPVLNTILGVEHMAHDLEFGKFWHRLKQRGLQVGAFTNVSNGQYSKKITSANAAMGRKLVVQDSEGDGAKTAKIAADADLYTTPEVYRLLNAVWDSNKQSTLATITSLWKFGKVLSPAPWMRNLESSIPMLVLNGHMTTTLAQAIFDRASARNQSKTTRAIVTEELLKGKTSEWASRQNKGIRSEERLNGGLTAYQWYEAMISRGVLDPGQNKELMLDMLKVGEWARGSTNAEKAASVVDFFGRVYISPDIWVKSIAFQHEVKLLRWYYGKGSMELAPITSEILDAAAEKVADGYQTYERLPQAIRNWSKAGTFASFSFEMLRNVANNVANVKTWSTRLSDALRQGDTVKAAKATTLLINQISGLVAATFGAYWLKKRASKWFGFTSEEVHAFMRSGAFEGNQNVTPTLLGRDGTKITYMDTSNQDPYQLLDRFMNIIVDPNKDLVTKAGEMASETQSALIPPPLSVKVPLELASGRAVLNQLDPKTGFMTWKLGRDYTTSSARMDFPDFLDIPMETETRAYRLYRNIAPTIMTDFIEGGARSLSLFGLSNQVGSRVYTAEDQLKGQTGFQIKTADITAPIMTQSGEFHRQKIFLSQRLNKELRQLGNEDLSGRQRVIAKTEREWKKVYAKYANHIQDAIALGVGEDDIFKAIDIAQVNKYTRYNLIDGVPTEWEDVWHERNED